MTGPGTITNWTEPVGDGIRIDAGYQAGNTVSLLYDSLMAKLIVRGQTREAATTRARSALTVTGPKVNTAFFQRLLDEPAFLANTYTMHIVEEMH